MALTSAKLKPCYHQVGGHMTKDQQPESYIDDEGRFYKPYTDGPRALRERMFYAALFTPAEDGRPRRHACYPSPHVEGQVPEKAGSQDEPRLEDVEGLKPFVPKYYGTLDHEGRKLITLEDMCRHYRKPCVMDLKMGFTTVYDWAEESYKIKNRIKDADNTNSTVGFRVSGLQVYRADEDAVFKPERNWGKTLTKDNIHTAFQLFASGGRLSPREIYGDPEYGALQLLRRFESWAQRQSSFQFFQASVLIIYEGQATDMRQAGLRVAFIDFAHTFQTVGGARDENLVASLASLISILERVAAVA